MLAFLVISVLAGNASADEPPSFEPFTVKSADGSYMAMVEPGLTDPSLWAVAIYDKRVKGSLVRVWLSPLRHLGYPSLILANDGASFVSIDVWYHDDAPVLEFYRMRQKLVSIKGSEIPFDRSKMVKTADHELWLIDGGTTYGKSASIDEGTLRLVTVDGKVHHFDLLTGKRVDDKE